MHNNKIEKILFGVQFNVLFGFFFNKGRTRADNNPILNGERKAHKYSIVLIGWLLLPRLFLFTVYL